MAAQRTFTRQQLHAFTGELVAYQDQLAAIHELAHHFSGQLNLTQVLHGLVQTAVRALRVQAAAAHLALAERPSLTVASPAWTEPDIVLADALAQVQQRGDALLQNESGRSLPLGAGSRLLLPLIVRGQTVGVVALADRHRGSFTTADVKLGQALTAQLEVQIENTVWHEAQVAHAAWLAQVTLAREVQRCLLPQRLPQIPGVALWATSTSLHEVGGDLYDFILTQRAAPLFAVGDVCGKGVAAAMLMAMTRTTLRNADAFLPRSTPARLLEYVNTALYADYSEAGLFSSLFVGQYLPNKKLLRYANAGHAPVVFCPAQGDARLLPAGNASIGLLPEAAVVESTLPFGPGDVLVVATDGFTEAMNGQDELFGYRRLLEAVSRSAGQSAASIGAVIQAVVAAFANGRAQTDDQTLVVLKGIG